jgi:hypothetical protein
MKINEINVNISKIDDETELFSKAIIINKKPKGKSAIPLTTGAVTSAGIAKV